MATLLGTECRSGKVSGYSEAPTSSVLAIDGVGAFLGGEGVKAHGEFSNSFYELPSDVQRDLLSLLDKGFVSCTKMVDGEDYWRLTLKGVEEVSRASAKDFPETSGTRSRAQNSA